ncbi:MAG TPA: PQQ-binding-like beta-propeller repeat protein, partial [Candidatus Acidoferrales bacterium]|nr:PQQ-binding-like beta-propeller repeat protein [Candidatus Acidoferrales bacterium]
MIRPALLIALVLASCGAPAVPVASAAPTASAAAPSPVGPSASPAPTASPSPTSKVSVSDWPTYHRDQARTGFSAEVASFTTVEPAWQSDALNGDVYAEPLVVGGYAIVATERNVVYSIDAKTGAQHWRTTLGTPVTANTLPCGNIGPVTGITGTPVADANAGLVYVVAFETPLHHQLYALDLASGEIRFQRAVDAPGNDPRVHQQRSALSLANGRVYIAYGGLAGDCGPYRGTVVAVSASSAAGDLEFYRVPANREGGMWAPSGLAVDPNGKVYAVAGNSDTSGRFDMNDSLLRFAPDLALEDYWAPADWLSLSRSDTDIGSVGPTLIPNDRVIESGKNGVLYVMRASALGGIGGQGASLKVCGSVFGGFAFANGVAYVPCSDGVAAVQI